MDADGGNSWLRLGRGKEEEEKVHEVLDHEGVNDVEIVDMATEGGTGKLVFVTGDFLILSNTRCAVIQRQKANRHED